MKNINIVVAFLFCCIFGVQSKASQLQSNPPMTISVIFDKNPVKVGIGNTRSSETLAYPATNPLQYPFRLTASITPASKAGEISFKSSLPARATVSEVSRNTVGDTVQVILKVVGLTETPVASPAGDAEIQAVRGSDICATTKVVVIIPATRVNTVAASPTAKWNSIDGDNFRSHVRYNVEIKIYDQFGSILNDVYNGNSVVTEQISTMQNALPWTVIEFPDKEFISGVKNDTAESKPYFINPGATATEKADWLSWSYDIDGRNNAIAAHVKNGTLATVNVLIQLKVDGHYVTPNYGRTYIHSDTEFPGIPLTVRDIPRAPALPPP